MDVSDYLRSGFQVLHKTQNADFGKTLTTETKSKQLVAQRKNNRNKLMLQKRFIDETTMSPFKTPKVPDKRNQKLIQQEEQMKKRLDMLKKWQMEKQKKLDEKKAKQKPLFKVTRIPATIGMVNLENVNKTIKGKSFTRQAGKVYNFAPYEHKFKAPDNIKPINIEPQKNQGKTVLKQKNIRANVPKVTKKRVLINVDTDSVTPKKQAKVYKKTPAKLNAPNTKENKENLKSSHRTYELRNRNVQVSNTNSDITKIKTPNSLNKRIRPKLRRQSNVKSTSSEESKKVTKDGANCSGSELSSEYPMDECFDTTKSDALPAYTPKKEERLTTPDCKSTTCVYISPFVTISRGKNSARKEFHSRKSKGGTYDSSPDIRSSTGPQAGAAYFRRLLDQEISRMESLCEEWNMYKLDQNPAEEVCDMINVAIGQSQLLIRKKFKQFSDLIDSCENNDSKLPITCEDLHGYWDVAYIQVDNLNNRFANLAKMRANNWEEVLPKIKKGPVKKTVAVKRKVQASSSIREAIKAARNKAKINTENTNEVNNEVIFDGILFSVKSPKKSPKNRVNTPAQNTRRSARKSLLVEVLSKESGKRLSSPGLVMLKVSRIAKSLENSIGELNMTPGKSILKSARKRKSSARKPKSVLFKENDSINDEEAEVPVNLPILSPQEDNSRRYSQRRLTRSKLF